MSFMLTRMFTTITLFLYLVVGSVCVRVFMPKMTTITFSTSYFSVFSEMKFSPEENVHLSAPDLQFAEIISQEKKPAVVALPAPKLKALKLAKNELPFHEPVTISPVFMQQENIANLALLYREFKYDSVAQVEMIQDEVSSNLAAAEPEFFEYPVEKEEPRVEPKSEELTVNPVAAQTIEAPAEEKTEDVKVEDLITFDYSKVEDEIKSAKVPTVSMVTTQTIRETVRTQTVNSHRSASKVKPEPQNQETISPITNKTLASNRMTIQITGTDLKQISSEVGFELRFMDDQNESIQDYNSGSVTLESELAGQRMNRPVTVLKRGFAPTNTDLILEDAEAHVSLPMIEEETFNHLLSPYESRGPIGAVLVELDDQAEGAALDVPYSKVLTLTEDLQITEGNDFSYQLFIGVKAGNALLSFKGTKGDVSSKIIHVHERELTFESNFFEDVLDEKFRLVEEDLLGKEKTPLVISSEEVRQFATDKTVMKINANTFKAAFNRIPLGSRKYLELGHQQEPVFVGFKEATTLEIPSENFMRYILSRFEDAKLGNRCVVQVNLGKPATQFSIGTESVNSGLMASTQVLDADGKFYDSLSPKSRKIIIVGENHNGSELGQDGKINLKISYEDGSVEYLGSYCSPNTYLVEQL